MNKYHDELTASGRMFLAEHLLDLLRPKVAELAVKYKVTQPPSQHMQAKQIRRILRSLPMKDITLEDRLVIMAEHQLIRDFLAVHRVVWILEGKPL